MRFKRYPATQVLMQDTNDWEYNVEQIIKVCKVDESAKVCAPKAILNLIYIYSISKEAYKAFYIKWFFSYFT